jgi:Mob1/phocein family
MNPDNKPPVSLLTPPRPLRPLLVPLLSSSCSHLTQIDGLRSSPSLPHTPTNITHPTDTSGEPSVEDAARSSVLNPFQRMFRGVLASSPSLSSLFGDNGRAATPPQQDDLRSSLYSVLASSQSENRDYREATTGAAPDLPKQQRYQVLRTPIKTYTGLPIAVKSAANHLNDSNSSRNRSPFRPQKAGRGTTSWQLKEFAEATLGSGSLKKAVRLPEGEDENEWLAVNGQTLPLIFETDADVLVVDFYNQINLLYGAITEFCSPQTCPEMKATDEFEYLWQDSEQFKKPTKMTAPEYVEHLMAWCQSNIDNETLFPSRIGTSPVFYLPC